MKTALGVLMSLMLIGCDEPIAEEHELNAPVSETVPVNPQPTKIVDRAKDSLAKVRLGQPVKVISNDPSTVSETATQPKRRDEGEFCRVILKPPPKMRSRKTKRARNR